MNLKISVLIPIYNEAETIEANLARVQQVNLDMEIIVVDDCSTDGAHRILENLSGIKLVRHERNMGKGMAIRTALKYVTGDIVIVHDADLEYDPQDFHALIQPIIEGKANVVYGSRFLAGRPKMRLANYIANRVLTFTTNMLFRGHITDEATCYKVFRTDIIKDIPLTCKRFEFCPEVTAKILRQRIDIAEVPIHYTARTSAQGKKIGWKDGVVALWTLLKFRFVK